MSVRSGDMSEICNDEYEFQKQAYLQRLATEFRIFEMDCDLQNLHLSPPQNPPQLMEIDEL